MELSFNRLSFVDVLSSCCVVTGRNRALSILDNVLFRFEGGVLSLLSSDGDVMVIRKSACLSPIDFSGLYCVNGKDLLKILKSFSDVEFTLSFVEGGICVIGYSDGRFELPWLSGNDFPLLVLDGDGVDVSVSSRSLSSMLGLSRSFVATDALRPVMCGTYLYVSGGELGVCSTDGKRLYHSRELGIDESLSTECIIGASSLDAFLSLLSSIDGVVTLSISNRFITLSIDGVGSVSARMVDGRYPNFRAVIPPTCKIVCSVSRKGLLDALNRSSLCSDAIYGVVLEIKDGSICLTSGDSSLSRRSRQEIPCSSNGYLRIGVTSPILRSCLEVFSTDEVTLLLNEANKPIKISDDRTTALAMPILID
jgi:DNA polymerase-3 subunit beta